LIATTAFVLARTRLGILLRACGENPEAVWGAGFSVLALRYGATVVSGALAGMGGAALGLVGLGAFTQDMTAGRGYIALAAVVFGRWTPLGAALTALLFAFGDALQIALQTLGYAKIIPPDFLTLLPYLLTLGAIATKRPSKSRQK
jgi:simple sugar transport system permease protein